MLKAQMKQNLTKTMTHLRGTTWTESEGNELLAIVKEIEHTILLGTYRDRQKTESFTKKIKSMLKLK
jgi:hypothetical protein